MADVFEEEARARGGGRCVTCQWCRGTGREYLERGTSLCYPCPDCSGRGRIGEPTDAPDRDDGDRSIEQGYTTTTATTTAGT